MVDALGVAEGFEAIMPVISAHARGADAAKGQFFHRDVEDHVVHRRAARDRPVKNGALFAVIFAGTDALVFAGQSVATDEAAVLRLGVNIINVIWIYINIIIIPILMSK